MAAVTAPSRGSLLGKVAGALQARSQQRRRQPSKAAAAIRDHGSTLAALGFADTAAWHAGTTYGLIATAACILIAEFKVRG